MAIFRKIHVTFWSDSFISDLSNERKLFYLYLLTNERTKQCGIYEISKKQISFDLGLSIDTVSILFEYFIKIGKIKYSEETKEVAIKNWAKFNYSTSPKVLKCIESELKLVKNKVLIEYINSIDTLSQEEQDEEQEQEEKKNNNNDLIFSELIISESWIESTAMQSSKKFKPDEVKKFLKEFNDMINVQFDIKQNRTEYCTHFVNWLKKQDKSSLPVNKRIPPPLTF